MSTVVVSVVSQQQSFPAGTVSGGIKVSLSNGQDQVLTVSPYAATFTNVAVGVYTITAQTIGAYGNPLGAPVTGTVTIEAPAVDATETTPAVPATVEIDVPASLSVTVQ